MKKSFFRRMVVLAAFVFIATVAVDSIANQQVFPWNPDTIYLKGDRATWKNDLWEAKWWTQNEEPGTQGEWGVWKKVPQEFTLDIQKANWVARIDDQGFGVVELEIAGVVYGTNVVTVQTHGDGLIGEHKLKVSGTGAFNEVVQIKFTHAPSDYQFTTRTVVRAKNGDVTVVSKELISPTLNYYASVNTARLEIGVVGAHPTWGPIIGVEIDGVMTTLPCSVVLPKGNHRLYVVTKWWMRWYWSDIHTFVPGNPPNPRDINLTADTKIDIIVVN